ncbi:MAG: hypothetical protein A2534_02745 [Candidatus Magasanikbacteria bacterium RIFOXYD2_FULL_39_9]|uniref:FMN-binding domain-containing protein n=1 Tax=Candidatus Magasanikbacteria bacterium RIFOXYD1_FULL_40_23 TaxID=1798705 RepID=A0A1F6P7C6_9BACT|nr:MAG: hypothetical protein A2563_00720 [Candidatus Magasanikbacteria bacterium RIFOXYD1_FULL_40_23]OGH92171.1 MAG: hypothetical protein A2534_02745 [Candidatus Magasanikbacteria bacterium RIFOXYD2_FULL_39_9]
MKKILFSLFTIFVFAFYVVYQRFTWDSSGIKLRPPMMNQSYGGSTQIPAMGMGMMRGYRDGKYLGVSADAYYGRVQVAAIIEGGYIIHIQFLDFPQEQDTSKAINGMAVPILEQEAIAAQSAEVDIVSGATQTSKAFKQSLASALIQAKL